MRNIGDTTALIAFIQAVSFCFASSIQLVGSDRSHTALIGAAPSRVLIFSSASQRLPAIVDKIIIIEREPGEKNTPPAKFNDVVTVHYTVWLYDASKSDGKGALFASSLKQKFPDGFLLNFSEGKNSDSGLLRALVGMKRKAKRTLVIPSSLMLIHHHQKGWPAIPSNSALIFDVELVENLGGYTFMGVAISRGSPSSQPQSPSAVPLIHLPQDARLPSTPTSFMVIHIADGTGPGAELGDELTYHYSSWLYDSTKSNGKGNLFDSTYLRNEPDKIILRARLDTEDDKWDLRSKRAWLEAVKGMKVKGKRILIIPRNFSSPERPVGMSGFPGNTPVVQEYELYDIRKNAKTRN